MSQLCVCGKAVSSAARFCTSCGREITPRGVVVDLGWRTLNEIIDTVYLRFGAIGALLAFFSSFAPWASASYSFWGIETSWGFRSPHAWVVAVGGVIGALLLFRRRAGSLVLALGAVLAGWAVVSALTTLGENVSPSWGMALAATGGGLLAYSGYLTRQYEGR